MSMKLLHVEDNDLDALRVERALAKLDIAHVIDRAHDGIEALARISHSPCERYVVLLDLSLPRMNGFEFLAARERDPALAPMPVFVLSTSGRQSDIDRCYRYRIAGYLVKPATMPGMIDTLKTVALFWSTCSLPSTAGAAAQAGWSTS